jgi:FtsP/CotA-like multicopper oxidase with cupredoxin domain
MLGVTLLLFGADIAVTQAAQVLLPGALIPKFVDPLPEAGAISVVDATSAGSPNYNIHMREFQAQILPSSGVPLAGIAANTPSWVWGYLTDADVASLDPNLPRPSYLGPVVIAERGLPTSPTYLNELPYPAGNVQALLPIDQTLDWANPYGLNCNDPNLFATPACTTYTGMIPDSVHIHGGEVAPAYDGGPDAWFTQGNAITGIGYSSNTYRYENGQEEATIWFHPHGFGITRLNVFAGLAGVYPIVDPANPPLATMPAFPQHDIPLIIQDRSFDTTGQIFYNLASNPQPNPTVHPFWIPEFIGDAIVVNGKTWPYLNVEPRQYRFRLLNGSNARFYDLTMNLAKPNKNKLDKTSNTTLPFIAIATDDGYLVNAVSTPNVIIAPGERYEVIVDFTALPVGSQVVMMNSARTPFPGGGKPIAGVTDTVMQFRVVANSSGAPNTAIAAGTAIRPTPLQPINSTVVAPALPPAAPTGNIVRQLTLNEVIGPGGPLELVVNNSKYNLNKAPDTGAPCTGGTICRETELPAVGDTEIWEIINITADAHPMHTHLTSFQLLDRTPFQAAQWINQYDSLLLANGVLPGEGPPNTYSVRNADGAIGGNPPINAFLQLNKRTLPLPYEMGWKDTVITYPGEVTRIAVRWAPQDAPVVGTACDPNNPVAPCVPSAGDNLYPFDPTALINGVGYVWHCHILDHEDNEMMRTYTVNSQRQAIF